MTGMDLFAVVAERSRALLDQARSVLRTPWLAAGIVTVACLAPFLDKAFHIDDPVFVWLARQIAGNPLDPYGFDVNWYGFLQPVSEANINPPLFSCLLAVAGSAAGWGEIPLHLACLVPACLAVLGTWSLAKRHGGHPLLAAVVMAIAPAFWVSATTLMPDVTMLSLWVLSLCALEKGFGDDSPGWCAVSGLLAGLCVLTKYNGIGLVPLMGAYAVARKVRVRTWALALLIPALLLAAFEAVTAAKYGQGLFVKSLGVLRLQRAAWSGSGGIRQVMAGIAFFGGGVIPALFLSPLVLSRVAVASVAGVVLSAAALLAGPGGIDPALGAHWALFGISCGFVLVLAGEDLARRRDPVSVLLFLWIAGTWLSGTLGNWSINARGFLPAAPAVAILLSRRFGERSPGDDRRPPTISPGPFRVAASLLLSLAVALPVVVSDRNLAGSARTAARSIAAKYPRGGGTVFFEGHWGFQYYMQESGFAPLDYSGTRLIPGDVVVVPSNNCFLLDIPAPAEAVLRLRPNRWVTTMGAARGAGFYTSVFGVLPYAFGRVAGESYAVLRPDRPLVVRAGKVRVE